MVAAVYYRQEDGLFRYLLEDTSGYYVISTGDPIPTGGSGKKKEPQGKKHGARKTSEGTADFSNAPTGEFDVEVAKVFADAYASKARDVDVAVPAMGALHWPAIEAAMRASSQAIQELEATRARIRQQALDAERAKVAAQHAQWDQQALIIAVVNATLAA